MVYIGQTKTSLAKRWSSHRTAVNRRFSCFKLQKAIKEYGAENFTIEQIDCAVTKDEANSKEVYWIKHYNSIENGYNTSRGGRDGGHHTKVMNVETEQVFDTMVDAAKAFGVTPEAIRQAVKNPTWVCCGYHWRKFS